jgi:hypothetical protein
MGAIFIKLGLAPTTLMIFMSACQPRELPLSSKDVDPTRNNWKADMRLTLLVTIDSVKPLKLLDVLIHSLNLQTSRDFEVVFFNQTLHSESHLRSQLQCAPRFPHSYWTLPPSDFLGNYPLWDLYVFHTAMLDEGRISDYLMSLHMEEFLDTDYIEEVSKLLGEYSFDILFGNLRRTALTVDQVTFLLGCSSPRDFQRALTHMGVATSPHWSVRRYSRPDAAFDPRPQGFHQFGEYADEDVYLMSRRFAETHNWFLKGHHLYFEDIHLCQQRGVCELAPIIAKLTRFPVYFNARKIYHIQHHRFYFQIEDRPFTDLLLRMETEDPVIRSLQFAVREHRRGAFSIYEALRYSRQNPRREGTQDMNYRYHVRYLPPHAVPHMA